MARRPEFSANALTREQLKELKRSLSLLSPHTVRGKYEETLLKCRLRGESPPPPRLMQELVTLWRVLWRFAPIAEAAQRGWSFEETEQKLLEVREKARERAKCGDEGYARGCCECRCGCRGGAPVGQG